MEDQIYVLPEEWITKVTKPPFQAQKLLIEGKQGGR